MTSHPPRRRRNVTAILAVAGIALLAISILATFVVFFAHNADTITPTVTPSVTLSDTDAAAVTSTANAIGSLTPLGTLTNVAVTSAKTVVSASNTPQGATAGAATPVGTASVVPLAVSTLTIQASTSATLLPTQAGNGTPPATP